MCVLPGVLFTKCYCKFCNSNCGPLTLFLNRHRSWITTFTLKDEEEEEEEEEEEAGLVKET
jgi:hypothetical protein